MSNDLFRSKFREPVRPTKRSATRVPTTSNPGDPVGDKPPEPLDAHIPAPSLAHEAPQESLAARVADASTMEDGMHRAFVEDGIPPELLPPDWPKTWRAPKRLRKALRQGGLDAVRQLVGNPEADVQERIVQPAVYEPQPPAPRAAHDKMKHNTHISFKVSVETASEWRRMARSRGLTLSEFLRRMLYARLRVEDTIKPYQRKADDFIYAEERRMTETLALDATGENLDPKMKTAPQDNPAGPSDPTGRNNQE